MKNTTAMADYELRHIVSAAQRVGGLTTVLLKRTAAFPLEKPCDPCRLWQRRAPHDPGRHRLR